MKKRLRCILSVHNFAQSEAKPLHPDDPADTRFVYTYECLDCGTKRGEVR